MAPDPDPGSAAPALPEERVLPVRARWVRARLRVPELERLLGNPQGASISERFDSLRVRLQKAVDRIGESADAASLEIRQRAVTLRLLAMVSAALFAAAAAAAFFLPAFRIPAVLLAAAEGAAVVACGVAARRLARDLLACEALGQRFQEPLEAARTPQDLHRLAARIRAEVPEALGEKGHVVEGAGGSDGGAAGRENGDA